MFRTRFGLLALSAFLIMLMMILGFQLMKMREMKKEAEERKNKKKYRGMINKLNHSDMVIGFGNIFQTENLEMIFNRSKNPWGMTIATFQFIRYFGCLAMAIVAGLLFVSVGTQPGMLAGGCAFLFFWYPMYYYKAIGNERETEWNKMYEFIWVIKHNMMLYDPAKTYINVRQYIVEHAPHNQELIQGFDDFYHYWNPDEIDPYISRYYPFSIPREITQILFNTHVTGVFPEESLNSLRQFIINSQDEAVEKTLSGVSGKATMYSLPFMMVTVIIALMVPLVYQIMQYL